MYYEEKVIDGILHYRTDPSSNFQACTKQNLTQKILNLKEEAKRDKFNLEEGLKREKCHFSTYQWEKLQQYISDLV